MIPKIKCETNYNKNKFHNGKSITFGNNAALPKTFMVKLLTDGFSTTNKIKFAKKKLSHWVNWLKNRKEITKNYNSVMNLKKDSPEYIHAQMNICRQAAAGKEIEINLENGCLKNLANSNESCIFIMNHDNPKEDPILLGFFNALLSKEYIAGNKAKTCPRGNVITTKTILNEKDAKTKAIFEKFGYVGIDSSIMNPESNNNARAIVPIIKNFINNKTNIFVFPEGRMSKYPDLDIKYKFQTGIAKMISVASNSKEKVKVVPLGFSYKNGVGGIHVGEPVYFKKNGQNIQVSKGNINSEFASYDYTNFFKNEAAEDGFKTITQNGKPLKNENLPEYISGILCENLKICRAEANKALQLNNTEIMKL